MSKTTKTDQDPIAASTDHEVPSEGIHGVHSACQKDAPFKVTRCGIAVEDSGKGDAADKGPRVACPACDAARECPVCGARLPISVTFMLRAGGG